VYDCIEEPFIESAQAAYFLALAEWSAGKGTHSWMMLGVAVRSQFIPSWNFTDPAHVPQWRCSWVSIGKKHTLFYPNQLGKK
jgi:hypothetical protein